MIRLYEVYELVYLSSTSLVVGLDTKEVTVCRGGSG